jgi:uncharacterized SAM-binding protein YcdF (DUF218 family)
MWCNALAAMFFPLSKILGFFAIPSDLVISIGLLGLLLLPTRFARAGRALAFASLIVLAILGLSPVGNALMIPLEDRFPRWDAARGAPDGIIVLGGAISPDVSAARDEVALNEAAERLTVAAELARRYPAARIVFSGGSGALIYDEGAEAPFALRLLEDLGIPRARILLEDRSRNTVENAIFSKALIQPKPGERWLLVTSAHHLPRAIGVFRKMGFAVEPYPVDWRTRGAADALHPFATLGDGLRRSDTAVREWVGLAVYWLTGRSPARHQRADEIS